MTTVNEPETVTKVAFDQVQRERDQLKVDLAAARTGLSATALIDKAYTHLSGKVPDAYAAARAISRDSMFADVKDEDLPAKLETWLAEQKAAFGSGTPTPTGDPGTEPPTPLTPAAPTAPPPGAARSAPSPANPGGTPAPEKLNIHSKEVQEALKRGDGEQVKQWMREGRYEPLPGNQYQKTS